MSICNKCGRDAEMLNHRFTIVHTIYIDRHVVCCCKKTKEGIEIGKCIQKKVPPSTSHLKQSSPVPVTLTTALLTWILRDSGMNVLRRKGSSCHNVNCNETQWENTHYDQFNSVVVV